MVTYSILGFELSLSAQTLIRPRTRERTEITDCSMAWARKFAVSHGVRISELDQIHLKPSKNRKCFYNQSGELMLS